MSPSSCDFFLTSLYINLIYIMDNIQTMNLQKITCIGLSEYPYLVFTAIKMIIAVSLNYERLVFR